MKKVYVGVGRILYIVLLPFIRLVIRRTDRVYVCVSRNGEYLLVKNWLARNTWRLPGGGKRQGETYIEAAKRELQEEIGIIVTEDDMSDMGESVAVTDALGFSYHLFRMEIPTLSTIKIDPFEITDTMWVTELPSQHTAELDYAKKCLLDMPG